MAVEFRPTDDAWSSVSVPIIYDLNARMIGKERMVSCAVSLELFLSKIRAPKPSEIPELSTFNRELLVYFLRYVCVYSNMDGFVVFEASDQVEQERILICLVLTELDPDRRDIYLDEIKATTQRLVVNRGVRLVEQSKIYVDVEGVKRVVDSELREVYARYKQFEKATSLDEQMTELLAALQSRLSVQGNAFQVLFQPAGTTEAFAQLFFILRDAFISNNEHGLDGYLSVGIRHGTLSGQLRGAFERNALITQRDEAGSYLPNEHWRAVLLSTSVENLDSIQIMAALDVFSRRVDELVDSIRSTDLQIKTEKKNPEGLFDFSIGRRELSALQRRVSSTLTYEEAFDAIIEKLWQYTDESLDRIRSRVSVYKQQFNYLLDDLQKAAWTPDNESPVVGWDDAIAKSRTNIQDELDKVAGWFTRRTITQTPDFSIELPINVGIEFINNINPRQQINPIIEIKGNQKFAGRSFRYLVDIFFIILDNAITHSRLYPKAPIMKIECIGEGRQLTISVSNTVSSLIDLAAERTKIKLLQKSFGGAASRALVAQEGGTGLHKIWKILSVDLSCSHSMQIVYDDDNRFRISISLDGGWIFL